jgi:hypothetical protein
VLLYVGFNYSVYPEALDSHPVVGYWANHNLPNFSLSLGCNLFFLSAHCIEGLASLADAVKIADLGV